MLFRLMWFVLCLRKFDILLIWMLVVWIWSRFFSGSVLWCFFSVSMILLVLRLMMCVVRLGMLVCGIVLVMMGFGLFIVMKFVVMKLILG